MFQLQGNTHDLWCVLSHSVTCQDSCFMRSLKKMFSVSQKPPEPLSLGCMESHDFAGGHQARAEKMFS